ncbi:hypothetical protein ACFL2V_05260 [Pseudomonadota bacterium]
MNISGSSIAAQYAGNAALKLDHQAAQQQALNQKQLQSNRLRAVPNEQVLEGELLEGQARQANDGEDEQQASSEQGEGRQGQGFVNLEGGSYTQRALNQYQNNAQLDGFNSLDPLHQIDIYI